MMYYLMLHYFNVILFDVALSVIALFTVALCYVYQFTDLVSCYKQSSLQRGICSSEISSSANDMKMKLTLLMPLGKIYYFTLLR